MKLPGTLEQIIAKAIRRSGTYKVRADKSIRVFGGVNIVLCGDFWQLHPVTGTYLASNPLDIPAGVAQNAMNIFWGEGVDTLRSFWSRTEVMRCKDVWYNTFLQQCRNGNLTHDMCCFMHGLPTFTASQGDCNCNADTEHVEGLGVMKTDWKRTFLAGEPNMADYIARTECSVCAKERYRRRRVSYQDQMVTSDSTEFSHAPALYSFNVPRYFAILLRAQSFALSEQVQLTWCYAKDTPLHPEDRELPTEKLDAKRMAWLQRHDQDTSHLTSLLPLAVGLPVRLTDNVDRQLQLYRGRRGAIHGWTLDPFCESNDVNGDMLLDRLPLVIYVLFREATW